jgi:hypothetical protein
VNVGGFEVSRSTALMMLQADREAARELAERERAREEHLERAAAHAREYYAEHGEWERETIARQQAREQRAEDARLKKEQAEAAQWRQAQVAQLVASGRRYRTVSEVLAEAALYP